MMIPSALMASRKPERYNLYRSAAERALTGWPESDIDDESTIGKTPENRTIQVVRVPESPPVASRTSPGTVPMRSN